MKLTIRYFASIREALGSSETLEVEGPATVGAVRDRLIASSPRHAEQLAHGKALRMALDQELAEDAAPVRDGSVVAFFPPVTGAEMPAAARVSVQTEDFDLGAEIAALRREDGDVGAVVSFVGTVRDSGGVSEMELEHYPGMTERAIEAMCDEATRRFELRAVRVIHRVGRLQPLAQIVLVAVTSRHRGAAFQGCEFLMDYLKTQAPFWKKETTPEGARWVDARVADDVALARWGISRGNAAD